MPRGLRGPRLLSLTLAALARSLQHPRVVFCPGHRLPWVPPGNEAFRCVCWCKPRSAEGRSSAPDGVPLAAAACELLEAEDASMPMSTIMEVGAGKCTEVLQRSAVGVSDSLCLALISPVRTLDIQCESRAQRDALLRGFELLLFSA